MPNPEDDPARARPARHGATTDCNRRGPLRLEGNVNETPWRSFFMGGFECSTHRLQSGRRLDVIGATAHDRFALEDYRRLADAWDPDGA